MKKIVLSIGILASSMALSQERTGVNTTSPKATLEIAKVTANTTSDVEGILIPRVSKEKAYLMANATTTPEESTLVYVNDDAYTFPTAATDAQKAKVEEITENGYYFWNTTKWVKVSGKSEGELWAKYTDSDGVDEYYLKGSKENGFFGYQNRNNSTRSFVKIIGEDLDNVKQNDAFYRVALNYEYLTSDALPLIHPEFEYRSWFDFNRRLSILKPQHVANTTSTSLSYNGGYNLFQINEDASKRIGYINGQTFAAKISGEDPDRYGPLKPPAIAVNAGNLWGLQAHATANTTGKVDHMGAFRTYTELHIGESDYVRGFNNNVTVDSAATTNYLNGGVNSVKLLKGSSANYMSGLDTYLTVDSTSVVNATKNLGLRYHGKNGSKSTEYIGIFNTVSLEEQAEMTKLFGYRLHLNIDPNAIVDKAYGLHLDNINFGTTDNYAIYTNAGSVRFGDMPLSTVATDKVVVADADGILKTKDAASLVAANAEWKDGTNVDGDNLIYANQAKTAGNDVVITDDGHIGLGEESPQRKIHLSGNENTDGEILLQSAFNGEASPGILSWKSRGTMSAPEAVLKDDHLITLGGGAYDGVVNWFNRGVVFVDADEDWNETSHGTNIRFLTTQNGTNTRTEKMRIANDGKVGIGTAIPTATLDITATTENTTNDVEGLMLPRVSKNKAYQMGTNTDLQESTLIYVNDTSDYTTSPAVLTVADITENGYYFWNGAKWVKVSGKSEGELWAKDTESDGTDTYYLKASRENGFIGYHKRSGDNSTFVKIIGADAYDANITENVLNYELLTSNAFKLNISNGSFFDFNRRVCSVKSDHVENAIPAVLSYNGGHNLLKLNQDITKKINYLNGQTFAARISGDDPDGNGPLTPPSVSASASQLWGLQAHAHANTTGKVDNIGAFKTYAELKVGESHSIRGFDNHVTLDSDAKSNYLNGAVNFVKLLNGSTTNYMSGVDTYLTVGSGSVVNGVKNAGIRYVGQNGSKSTEYIGVFNSVTLESQAEVNSLYGYRLHLGIDTDAVVNRAYGLHLDNINFGATHNYAIYTNAGLVRFGDMPTSTVATDKIVVADVDGVLKTKDVASVVGTAASKFTNDATNTVVKLTNLSDGTTARTDDKNIFISDEGKLGIGTTTPVAKLEVKGNIKLQTDGGIWLSGKDGDTGITGGGHIDGSAYHTFLRQKSGKENVFNLGGYREDFGFYIYDKNRTVNGVDHLMKINAETGNVYIGNVANFNASEKLEVAGNVKATNFIATAAGSVFPDYVFEKYYNGNSTLKSNYNFKSLNEVETFVKAKGHLPGYTSAKEIATKGQFNMTEVQLTNVEKIEELYLHTIEQEKKIDAQAKEIQELKSMVKQLLKK